MGRTLSSDSANVIALPASPTGFTVGDYVYQTTAGYGIVTNGALATGVFDPGSVPVSGYSSTATTSNELTYVEQLGGSQGSQVAAQLTNGNIVYAYATGNTPSYASVATVNFRIETTAGAVVVAQTSTTMSSLGPYQVSVVALPAGGFCIVSTVANGGAAYNMNARFYNADGTVATAVLNMATNITSSSTVSRLRIQALTDGSVIIGYINNTTFELRKVTTAGFDATFGTSGVVTNLNSGAITQWWDFVTDSSNNIHAISSSGSTTLVMRRYNSGGVQQTTSTVSGLTGVGAVAIAISSSGTIRGFVQDISGVAVITWDGTTAALGTRIITQTLGGNNSTNAALGAFAQGASGGYVVFYSAVISTTSVAGLFLQAFDSSNVALAPATRVNSAIAVNYRNQFVPIVASGDTRVYFGVFQSNSISYTLNNNVAPMGIAYFAYSNTTYALVGAGTASYNPGTIGPYALGAYTRGASTATIARFSIATTGVYSTNYAAGSTLIPKTLIDGANTTNKLALAPLPNGEFVAAWGRNSGTFAIYITKYSATGAVLAGPVQVTTSGSSGHGNSYTAVSMATFANGNILVTFTDQTAGAGVLQYRIYTPSLTVVTSGIIDNAASMADMSATVSATSFGDGSHVAVLFRNDAVQLSVKAVRNDGTVTARLNTFNFGSSWSQSQVIGFKSNAFMMTAFNGDGSANVIGCVIRQTGPTTFSVGTNWSVAQGTLNGAAIPIGSSPIPCPGTTAYAICINSGAAAFRLISANPLANSTDQLNLNIFAGLFSTSGISANYGASVGYTPTGVPVMVTNRASTQFITISPFSAPMDPASSIQTTGGFVTTLATQNTNNSISVIPHIGEAVLIGYIDNNGYPSFTSIAALAFSVNATLTAGTSISTTTLNLTPQSGFAFQGVALTAAASGNSGFVQTSGIATLNSNYSASTPATFFDSRNPITAGTSGTIIGRTVIMGNN